MSIYDMAQMTVTSTGTGTITLGSAVTGFQSFAAAGIANNTVFSYGLTDVSFQWEDGQGTYITNSTGNFLVLKYELPFPWTERLSFIRPWDKMQIEPTCRPRPYGTSSL